MHRKCSVFGCKTNYATGPRGVVYSFPADKQKRDQWIGKLPNDNFQWRRGMVICAPHWPAEHRTRVARSKTLNPYEPPSLFSVPVSCLPTSQPPERKSNSFVERNVQPDELEMFEMQDALEAQAAVAEIPKRIENAICHLHAGELSITSSTRTGALRDISVFVDVSSGKFTCYRGFKAVQVPMLQGKINRYSEVEAAVNFLRNYEETDERVEFVERQLIVANGK